MEAFASQHTESFAEFLRQAGVSLAVSTYQAGQLVLVRAQEQGANTHFIAMRKPMGIAVQGRQKLTIGDAHRIEFFRNMPAVGRKLDHGQYDAAYLHRATHVSGDIDVHEMAYDVDEQLWLINTRMSCLCTLAADASVVPRWKPPFITQYDLFDRCHLNGLGMRDGRPRYVSMLGRTDEPGGWRRNKASGGQILDLGDDSVIVDGLCMPHSPRWYRDRLWFLSSGEGHLKCLQADGTLRTVAEVPGFARGLAFFGRYALIGLSQVRETAVFAGLPLTQRVTDRRCGVYLIDIEAGEVVGFLHFIGAVREIFDVQILSCQAPTLVEQGSPLLSSSYELPDAALAMVAPADPIQDQVAEATRVHAAGRLDEALAIYRDVLRANPGHRQAHYQLGVCLLDAESWQDACEVLLEVVTEQPDNAEACNSLGLACSRLLEYEQAIGYFDKAIAIDQEFPLAHFNRGLVQLKLGRYEIGWQGFDWRWQLPKFVSFRCPQPQWMGEDISEKRLLVHSEQDHGDHIQFWRYLKFARAQCRELIYVGPEKLRELAAGIDGVDESRAAGSIPADRFDVFVPLMSLPVRLGMIGPGDAASPCYLRVPDHIQVRSLPAGRRVGIVWAGSSTYKDDHRRSIPAELLKPLLAVEDIEFYSFQYPVSAEEIALLGRLGVKNLEPEIEGYARAAAFIMQMDLVISVDTAVAHLAAALGKPVWILLARDADWRWGLHGEKTDWYPTARLFRQSAVADWASVIDSVRRALLRQR
ncbi:MAG TPA: TIGR03032 family protein [Dokdonella sp.]|uniref:TIGR03032 family protein n=1 Tax=Dokdonella sp. TaxID=2291710 RepID=UPI002D7F7967|nr:TIGR03032 family protein [Dokdonella sp.]HET9033976.1 TIGR03032 family protein [Dokdonella sp.]